MEDSSGDTKAFIAEVEENIARDADTLRELAKVAESLAEVDAPLPAEMHALFDRFEILCESTPVAAEPLPMFGIRI